MLASAATIAAAVSALIAVGVKLYNSYRISQDQKNIDLGRTLEQKILGAKTNEERANYARDLNDHK